MILSPASRVAAEALIQRSGDPESPGLGERISERSGAQILEHRASRFRREKPRRCVLGLCGREQLPQEDGLKALAGLHEPLIDGLRRSRNRVYGTG